MATKTVNTHMRQIVGTKAALADKVPLAGELVFETDTEVLKIGNGTGTVSRLKGIAGQGAFLPLAGGTCTGPVVAYNFASNAGLHVKDINRGIVNSGGTVTAGLTLGAGTIASPSKIIGALQVPMTDCSDKFVKHATNYQGAVHTFYQGAGLLQFTFFGRVYSVADKHPLPMGTFAEGFRGKPLVYAPYFAFDTINKKTHVGMFTLGSDGTQTFSDCNDYAVKKGDLIYLYLNFLKP